MIVEIEEEDVQDFETIYSKDYIGKEAVRPIEYRPLPQYPPPLNILNGPYKEYLNTRLENQSLLIKDRSEDPEEYLKKIHNKFPHLKDFLPQIVPDEKTIERQKNKLKKSIYQTDYGEFIPDTDESFLDYFDRKIRLPQDWMILETIQKCSYRDPWMSPMKHLIKPKIIIPSNSLDPNPKEREILQITTGNSEYMNEIGITGAKMMLRGLGCKFCVSSDTK